MADISWLNFDEEIKNTFTMNKKLFFNNGKGERTCHSYKTIGNRFVRG